MQFLRLLQITYIYFFLFLQDVLFGTILACFSFFVKLEIFLNERILYLFHGGSGRFHIGNVSVLAMAAAMLFTGSCEQALLLWM